VLCNRKLSAARALIAMMRCECQAVFEAVDLLNRYIVTTASDWPI